MPHESWHTTTAGAAFAGGAVSAMLFAGSWYDRLIAGIVGAFVAWFGAPVFSPIVFVGISALYNQVGASVEKIPQESIPGLTGFLLGVFGIHLIVWVVDRLKRLLAAINFPGSKLPPNG